MGVKLPSLITDVAEDELFAGVPAAGFPLHSLQRRLAGHPLAAIAVGRARFWPHERQSVAASFRAVTCARLPGQCAIRELKHNFLQPRRSGMLAPTLDTDPQSSYVR